MTEEEQDELYADAIRAGARRAGGHLIRAGIELVSGISAFLDELIKVREGETPPERPQKIELE